FAFRVIHIQTAVVLFLFALVLLWDLAGAFRVWRFVLMSALLAASLLMYQIAAAAVLFSPFVLLLRFRREQWRRLVKVSALLLAPPISVGLYWLSVATTTTTYEFQTADVAPRPSPHQYASDLVGSYEDQLLRAWRPAQWVTWEPRYIALGAACGLL